MYKKAKYVTPACELKTAAQLGLRVEKIAGDTILIKNKTPLAEFFDYIKGYRLEGESFVPKSNNPNSLFMEYFNYRKSICIPKPARQCGEFKLGPQSAPPKIIYDKNPDDYMTSLIKFSNFAGSESKLITQEQYYSLIDDIANLIPAYVRQKYPTLRTEIAENSGRLFKYIYIFGQERKGMQTGEIVYGRFFNKNMKEKALSEYVNFLEELTAKKVIVGCPTRMGFSVDAVTAFNNPDVYKDFDYILLGHGTGSSFANLDNPNFWRFSDNGKSVWEFIEERVPKGEKVLALTCEEDAEYWKSLGRIPLDYSDKTLSIKEKLTIPEMLDKDGKLMNGVGNTVLSNLSNGHGAKICESGKRHIIGTVKMNPNGKTIDISDFINSAVSNLEIVYYKT